MMPSTLHSHIRSARTGEDGFTLIELLVAMTLSILVLFALLTTLDNFTTGAARQTRRTDASDQVRQAMDRVVRDLRQASTIEVADPNDLVYRVVDSATVTRRERICLDAATSIVWRSSVTNPPAAAIGTGTPCPTPATGAGRLATLVSANSASNQIFRYDSAAVATVRTVGITLSLNAGTTGHTDISTLRTSAFVRSQAERAPAVTRTDIGTTCNGLAPVLTLSATFGTATVSYSDLSGASLGATVAAGTPLQLASTATTVVATITTSNGGVTQLVKSIACNP